jgi:SAM-dependent methyltransferase
MENETGPDCTLSHDPLIRCPECGGAICGRCGECGKCGRTVPSEGGVLRFLARDDHFYEGAYRAQVHLDEASLRGPAGRLVLPLVNFGYLKLILDAVPRGSRVLELGCGAGMRIAGERYRVTALDLSRASLLGTPDSYRHRIQADALNVEFLPGSFDAAFGSCFFEHLAPPLKSLLLEKLFRWLKPGGTLVLLFDTESGNPLFRWLRKDPELYRKCFVEHDGHVGLEPVSVNRELFREKGFVLRRGIGLNRTVQHLPVYTWMAPYGSPHRWVLRLSRLSGRIGDSAAGSRAFTTAVHLWDITAGRLFPLDWSRLYLGCWKRP